MNRSSAVFRFRFLPAVSLLSSTLILCLCAIYPASGQERRIARPASDAEIQQAIARATACIKLQLPSQSAGRASIAAVSLLKSGVSRDTPEIKRVLEMIQERIKGNKFVPVSDHVYEAGVSLMALSSADPVVYKIHIRCIADFIIDHQAQDGFWDYPSPSAGDTSITQYAMLGLWEAARAGVRVPLEVWDRAASWHVSRQLNDGGFEYHPNPGSNIGNGLHSMTVAGIGSLHIARRHLYPDAKDIVPESTGSARRGNKFGVLERLDPESEPDADRAVVARDRNYVPRVRLAAIDEAIAKGLKWMTLHFTVDNPTGYPIYYLYGLERMAALASLQEIGPHDWYQEGSAHLVRTQAPDGSWNDPSGPQTATCFGLLFLTKATAKMLGKKPAVQFGSGLLAGGRGLPDNLASVQVKQGKVETKKLEGGFEKLLAELENPQSQNVESAQAGLVEKVLFEHPEELLGQKDRLLKLAIDPRAEVRRTAMWALGRSSDLRVTPVLIGGLEDSDPDVALEARQALRILSRKITGLGGTDRRTGTRTEPDAASGRPAAKPENGEQQKEAERWRAWYRSVRPYDERDDLPRPN